jgi:hypothetical protein
MDKVIVKGKELHYKGNVATFSDKWIECAPKSKTKRVMLGGFKRECTYTFNGVTSIAFSTIKSAKESFASHIDSKQVNKLRVDLGKDVLGNDIADIFGINELINR